ARGLAPTGREKPAMEAVLGLWVHPSPKKWGPRREPYCRVANAILGFKPLWEKSGCTVPSLQRSSRRMFGMAGWLVAGTCILAAATAAHSAAPEARVVLAKLGISYMSKTEQANLWKLVDEYATVDALQEFCGTK